MARQLPAGMRNKNPGNIKYVGQKDAVGPSVNTDQGDPQAVYATEAAGMRAMYNLLSKKYRGGKVTPDMMIAGQGGWTPGNHQAAANVARSMGIGPNDDIGFSDPARAAQFMRALMLQEHGEASRAYSDELIRASISGAPAAAAAAAPSANSSSPYALPPKGSIEEGKRDTPSSGHPIGSELSDSPYTLPAQEPYGGPGEGGAHFGGGVAGGTAGLGTPGTADNPLIVKAQENPLAKVGAAVAKLGNVQQGNTLGGISNVPNPTPGPMPAVPTIDPASAQRQQLAMQMALMRLNSGQLWPMGGGGQQLG